jgi:hypothetical protein
MLNQHQLEEKNIPNYQVTQYSNLMLTSDITTPPFNGFVGGVIAFEVAHENDTKDTELYCGR